MSVVAKYVPIIIITKAIKYETDGNSRNIKKERAAPTKGATA